MESSPSENSSKTTNKVTGDILYILSHNTYKKDKIEIAKKKNDKNNKRKNSKKTIFYHFYGRNLSNIFICFMCTHRPMLRVLTKWVKPISSLVSQKINSQMLIT
jgi:hypothetical protein